MADIDIFNLKPSVIDRSVKGKYILIYGKSKSGKTSFAVQAPRTLTCAFELGLNALSGQYYVPMPKWADFKKVLSQLRKPQAKEMYDTIVIDTATWAYDLCEKYVCQRENVSSIREIPWGQGWGMVKKEFSEALREITMLGFGVILICHDKEKSTDMHDEDGNPITMVEPDGPRQMREVIDALVDIIGYIGTEFDPVTKESTRYLYTRSTPYVFAGSRYKYLAPKIKFGYEELVAAIAEAIDKDVELNGAQVTDHVETVQIKERPFQEVMADAKNAWMEYISSAKDEEEKEQHLMFMKDIIRRVFGSEDFKLSQAVPSQVDLVELFIDEMKNLE